MKNLFFSLICFGFIFPNFILAQATQDDILNNITTTQTETSSQDTDNTQRLIDAFTPNQQQTPTAFSHLSPEDQEFMRQRPGESPSDYNKRIIIENAHRASGLKEGPILPSVFISTTQIPPNDTTRPSLDALPPMRAIEQPSTPRSSENILDQIVPQSTFEKGNTLNTVLNQLFWAGLVIAVILANVMIIMGGIQYMTTDAISGKEEGKERIKAALGGLILAFSTVVILNTINPDITDIKLSFQPLKQINVDTSNIKALEFEVGERVRDLGVRNSYEDSEGNYILERPDGTRIISTPEGRSYTQYPDGTIVESVSSGRVFENLPAFPNRTYETMARDLIRKHRLTDLIPRDQNLFFNAGGTEEEWLGLIVAIARYESNFNPTLTYQEDFKNDFGEWVISTGLMQVSYVSVRGYANFNSSLRNITTEDLKDPYKNLDAGITVLKRLIERYGYISGPKNSKGEYQGGAAYWSVLRPTGKLEQVKRLLGK